LRYLWLIGPCVRGGSNLHEVFKTGSGIRNGAPPTARLRTIGVRPARRVLSR
jgi:hypothetical protein